MAITKNDADLRQTGLSWLTLFATGGTLICCALPIEFRSVLGHRLFRCVFGVTVADVVGQVR
ncbi:MAG: hypothetical protein IH913_14000 [Proteobacteria bacterium]|nr:hypothetical protein [Pseudomonadota bacterium]